VGTWTKCGNIYFCTFELEVTGATAITGALLVDSLPFEVTTAGQNPPTCFASANNIAKPLAFGSPLSGTHAIIFTPTDGTGTVNWLNTDIQGFPFYIFGSLILYTDT
jgi:hypothetical protein